MENMSKSSPAADQIHDMGGGSSNDVIPQEPPMATTFSDIELESEILIANVRELMAVISSNVMPPLKRYNMKTASKGPQSFKKEVRALKTLLPAGTAAMDTASILEETIDYIKFLDDGKAIMEEVIHLYGSLGIGQSEVPMSSGSCITMQDDDGDGDDDDVSSTTAQN